MSPATCGRVETTWPLRLSPRIIPIPLSGDLRKAQAKGVRHADELHDIYFEQSKLIRSAAEAKIREADRLECEAWNALMWAWATGEMRPCPRACLRNCPPGSAAGRFGG